MMVESKDYLDRERGGWEGRGEGYIEGLHAVALPSRCKGHRRDLGLMGVVGISRHFKKTTKGKPQS